MNIAECFGKEFNKSEACSDCGYLGSCKFALEDSQKSKESDNQYQSKVEEYHDISMEDDIPVDISKDTYSRDDLLLLTSFLLRISDDKKLIQIVHDKLTDSSLSLADIARQEGVSRVAIHNRIGKALAKTLGFKQKQVKDSTLLKLTPLELVIYKLRRDGFSYREIGYILNIPKSTIHLSGQLIASKLGLNLDTKNIQTKKS